MPRPGTLRELLHHHDWANRRVLQGCRSLTDDALDGDHGVAFGSLRRTLHHVVAVDRLWLDRWLGTRDARFEPFPRGISLAEIATQFESVAARRESFLDERDPAGESEPISFRDIEGNPYSIPLGDLLMHVANHGIHHRAQAQFQLRRSGAKPVGLDYLFQRVEEPTVAFTPDVREKLGAMGFDPGTGTVSPPDWQLDVIREYFRFSDWAQGVVHESMAQLGDEELDRDHEFALGSVRKTLLHIRDAERWWLDNWQGKTSEFDELPPGTSLTILATLARETREERDAFLSRLTDQDLDEVVIAHPSPEVGLPFRIGESLLQLPTHGTHHRAQILAMGALMGRDSPRLDYARWAAEP